MQLYTRVGFGMRFFRDPESQIPIPGILDRDFLIWARSKNPENSEIPGIRILISKPRKSGKSRVRNPKNPGIPGINKPRYKKPDKKPPLTIFQVILFFVKNIFWLGYALFCFNKLNWMCFCCVVGEFSFSWIDL